jgi:energy-coupling factor transporter ATP-binding protein EcfA2
LLKRLHVSGFKAIRDAELSFGRVNMFIGANGSGKSTILEAIGLLSASLEDINDIGLRQRGVRLSVPIIFKSSFKNHKLLQSIRLEAEFERNVAYDVSLQAGVFSESLSFFSEKICVSDKKLMGRSSHGINVEGLPVKKQDIHPTRGVWDRFGELIDAPEEMVAELSRMARYAIYAPQTGFLRGIEVEQLPVQPIGLQGGGLPQAAATIFNLYGKYAREDRNRWAVFKEIFDLIWAPGWAESISIEKLDPKLVSRQVITGANTLYLVDRFMQTKRNKISAYDSSEGTLYLLFILALLLHPEAPKIFSLDNVDNALNPSTTRLMLERLIQLTCSEKSRELSIGPDQVFLTSHNPTALDAFDLFDDNQRIFVVSRDAKGITTITRLQPEKGWTRSDWIKAMEGRSLSERWIENEIPGALGKWPI